MHSGKFKSFKSVLWRAMRLPLCSDLSEEQAADYALELIRRLGLTFSYGEGTAFANIRNYRASIPEDLIYIRGVRYLTEEDPLQVTYDTTPDFITDEEGINYLTSRLDWIPVKYTGNIYQSSYHCKGQSFQDLSGDISYTVNNNYMYLSEATGVLEFSYRKILLDDEGYPLIPDNQSFEDAVYYYILKEHLFGLLAVGKVVQSFYNKIEQEYNWAVAQASNKLKLVNTDHWEATMNGIRRLIQPQNFSDSGYKELHRREQIKTRH